MVSKIISNNTSLNLNQKTIVKEANHTHSNGSSIVSKGDKELARKVQSSFPDAKLNNYTTNNGYTPFGMYSIPGLLHEIVITPHK